MVLRRLPRVALVVLLVTLVLGTAGGAAAAGGPTEIVAAGPRVEPQIIMSEGFEGFWPSGLWTVLDGDGAAMGEYYWDDDDYKPHTGLWSAWAANSGINGLDPASADYPNFADSWMRYGPFDLRPYSAAHLEFWYWNQSEENCDFFFWGAAPDGNTFVGTSVSGDSGGWVHVDFDLSGYLGDDSVWIAFRFSSDGTDTAKGPFVDDINLWGTPASISAFNKTYPLNGAGPVAVNSTLAWSSATHATVYQYCVDKINNNACDDAWTEVGTTSTSAGGLDYLATYYWQVRAVNPFDVSYADGGTWFSFTTMSLPNDDIANAVELSAPMTVTESVGTATTAPADPGLSCAGSVPKHNTVWFTYTAPGYFPLVLDTFGSNYDTVLAVFTGSPGDLHELACNDDAGSMQSEIHFLMNSDATYYIEVAAFSPAPAGELTLNVASPALTEGAFRAVGDYDGWVRESAEDAGKGGLVEAGAATLRVGDDASDRQYRAILDFDTASLPDDAVVTGVTLRVKRQGFTGKNPILTHGYLKVDMRSGFFHNIQALETYDFQAPASRGNVGRFIKVMDPDGWYRAPLRAPSYGLVNLTGTTQFRLRFDLDDNDDGGADYLSLFSGEPANDADRPELIITYYVP